MNNREIEAEVRRILEEDPEEGAELEEFVEENEDDYDGELYEYAFRQAVIYGCFAYVEEHAGDVDLNDEGGYSSYLDDTQDARMQELLIERGAFRSWDCYDDCVFALETVNGSVLYCEEAFQKKAFERYLKLLGLTEEEVVRKLADGEHFDDGRDVDCELSLLGAQVENGALVLHSIEDEEMGFDLVDLLEELGWSCAFEGDSWTFETLGVYYIRD